MLRILISSVVLWVATPSAVAQVTSTTHPRLKQILEKHAAADTDRDGVLSYSEYQAFQKSQGPRKRPGGGEAGPISTLLPSGDLLITGFEENNFGRMRQWGWTIEGDSFARDFSFATKIMKRRAVTLHGKYLLSSFAETDTTTGRIASPNFEIEMKYIQFQLSGGDHPARTCINLVVDGEVLRTATGRNLDRFETVAFDVTSLKGRQASVEMVDAYRGIWGHVNVDQVVQTDRHVARRVINTRPTAAGKIQATVQVLKGRHRGPLVIRNGQLEINQQLIGINNVLQVICDNAVNPSPTRSALRLLNGEIWYGDLLGLNEGKVMIQNPTFAKREVPLDQIACIDFKPGKIAAGQPGTLYREQGEPIPGKLVWIRNKDVAIDCVLGVVPIPRERIQRFVLATPRASLKPSQAEVSLVDGSLLGGELTVEGDHLMLKHRTLGSLTFPWSAIRYIRRNPKDVVWFDRLNGEILAQVGPVLPPPKPGSVKSPDQGVLRTIRMMPKTVTRYTLPAASANRFFRATLAPLPGCKAGVNVRVKSGDRVVWKRKIAADSEPVDLTVALEQNSEFIIEVDYSDRLGFPCGVDWRDSYVK